MKIKIKDWANSALKKETSSTARIVHRVHVKVDSFGSMDRANFGFRRKGMKNTKITK